MTGTVLTRRAAVEDAAPLAALLTAIIAEGGRTAITGPVTAQSFRSWFLVGPHHVSCFVAQRPQKGLVGFQIVERFHEDLPPGVADIGTFVSDDGRRSGVGRALMAASVAFAAARDELHTLRAVIRARNIEAIRFYRSQGFSVDDRWPTTELSTTLTRNVAS
jgi:ribosomal protein S18 acetylase RimI-like enzyme